MTRKQLPDAQQLQALDEFDEKLLQAIEGLNDAGFPFIEIVGAGLWMFMKLCFEGAPSDKIAQQIIQSSIDVAMELRESDSSIGDLH